MGVVITTSQWWIDGTLFEGYSVCNRSDDACALLEDDDFGPYIEWRECLVLFDVFDRYMYSDPEDTQFGEMIHGWMKHTSIRQDRRGQDDHERFDIVRQWMGSNPLAALRQSPVICKAYPPEPHSHHCLDLMDGWHRMAIAHCEHHLTHIPTLMANVTDRNSIPAYWSVPLVLQ